MDTIYITGHRNPDTDSIVSAMAYAALKNALGQRQYEAARLGQISDETQTVLDRFGFQPPKLLNNVRTQVRDLDYDTPPTLSAAAAISRYHSSRAATAASDEAFRLTRKKYECGQANAVEYNEARQNLMSAQSDELQAKYEYLFRVKILDFYQGTPIQ